MQLLDLLVERHLLDKIAGTSFRILRGERDYAGHCRPGDKESPPASLSPMKAPSCLVHS
jgi:hypothetical protein